MTIAGTRPEDVSIHRLRRHRAARRLGLVVLAGFVLLGLANLVGIRTAEASAAEDGVRLSVVYAVVTRSGLATPWEVEVVSPTGFRDAVTITTTSAYFERFDFNAWYPEPASVRAMDGLLALTFERPEGDVLRIRFDGRASPSFGLGSSATTSIDTSGLPALSVDYRTVVMP